MKTTNEQQQTINNFYNCIRKETIKANKKPKNLFSYLGIDKL